MSSWSTQVGIGTVDVCERFFPFYLFHSFATVENKFGYVER